MKSWSRIAISCLLWIAGAAAFAVEPATVELQARLLSLNGVVTTFDQQISDAHGYLVEEAHGTLHLAKPYFRWEVEEPFPQIILADGEQIQIYDPDLEQVTQRQIGESLDQAPLALLTQSKLDLEQYFEVEGATDEGQYARFTLRPTSADALFARMELVFKGDVLNMIAIFDHTGQQTLIRFADYDIQQVIQSSVFELEFPPGTDFVRG